MNLQIGGLRPGGLGWGKVIGLLTAAMLPALWESPAGAQLSPVTSTFESGDEGWTAVDLGGDYRDTYTTEANPDCVAGPANVLRICDPDAGQWMFSAPNKFLGNKAAYLNGYIQFSTRDNSVDDAWQIDLDPYPDVVLLGTNIAVVRMGATPPVNQWTTYRYDLNESGQWAWVDGEAPMTDLPKATNEQIGRVLQNLTGILIRGEVITGDDQGWLANVILGGSGRPMLSIRALGDELELTWPPAFRGFSLESRSLAAEGDWSRIETHGTNGARVPRAAGGAWFRLRGL